MYALFLGLRALYARQPLAVITGAAVAVRLLAAVFAKGYGMYDDHFLCVEIAQSWIDGPKYWWDPHATLVGHSMLLPASLYALFLGCEAVGITDPQTKLLIVRLLLAAFSLLTVRFGYRIAQRLGGRQAAIAAGWVLALMWLMPFLSVRALIELLCVPFILWGMLLFLQADDKEDAQGRPSTQRRMLWLLFAAGAVSCMGFAFRYQSILMPAGLGFVLLLQRRWLGAVVFAAGCVVGVLGFQGVVDTLYGGYPFFSFLNYVKINSTEYMNYPQLPWYNYFLTIAGLMLPPLGLMLWWGFGVSVRKHWRVWVPAFFFFAFHSIFPNKQERFILPFVPYFVILGVVGWQQWTAASGWWSRHQRLNTGFWVAFWVLNTPLMVLMSVTYSKRSYCESMYYFHDKTVRSLVVEPNSDHIFSPPLFFTRQWPKTHNFTQGQSLDELRAYAQANPPDYVMLVEDKDRDARVARLQQVLPPLELVHVEEPGLFDQVIHWLNPVNRNLKVYLYKVKR